MAIQNDGQRTEGPPPERDALVGRFRAASYWPSWPSDSGPLLIALSLVPWLALAVLPFLGLGTAVFAAGGGVIVAAEVAFWLGLLLVGRDTWILTRSHGWRRVPGALWRVLRHGTVDRRPPEPG